MIFSQSNHISTLGLLNCNDIEIWNFAKKEGFIIVTFDSDFYDLSILNGCPPKIIWLRTGNLTTNQIVATLEKNHLKIRNLIENPEKQDIACLEIE